MICAAYCLTPKVLLRVLVYSLRAIWKECDNIVMY